MERVSNEQVFRMSKTYEPGSLKAAIDTLVEEWKAAGGDDDPLFPKTIFYGDAARQAKIPGVLRIHKAKPLDLLTILVASANCKLVPITRPSSQTERNADRFLHVLGYRIVQENLASVFQASSQDGQTTVELPNDREGGRERGAESRGNNVAARVVRIYGLAISRLDPNDESEDVKKKQHMAMEFVHEEFSQALQQAIEMQSGKVAQFPELSYHAGTGALIAKATESQHRLIADLVKAVGTSNDD